jgi:hypothetical protein
MRASFETIKKQSSALYLWMIITVFSITVFSITVFSITVFSIIVGDLHIAHAHLIREGHAQLTFKENGVYFMASYPIQAFSGFDDDGDHLLNERELSRHQATLKKQVLGKVSLMTEGVSHPLEGLVLNISHSHRQYSGANYLIVMGRFKAHRLPKSSPKLESFRSVFRSLLFMQESAKQESSKIRSTETLRVRVRKDTQVNDYQLSPHLTEIMITMP